MSETWRIWSDAGPRDSVLVQFLREEGVRVQWQPPDELRGVEWASDIQQVVSMLIATGTAAAVKTAIDRFRQRYKDAHVSAEIDTAKPEDKAQAESRDETCTANGG